MTPTAPQLLEAQLPQALASTYVDRAGDPWAVIHKEAIVEVAQALKTKLGYRLFLSMDAVDRLHLPPDQQEPRFEVLYFLKNVEKNDTARLKVLAAEDEAVPTICRVYQGADWAERFVFDFYGITFTGHPNLRRILMYPEFQGYPLRKDFPLRGRQPLVPERPIKDLFRGPGTNGVAD